MGEMMLGRGGISLKIIMHEYKEMNLSVGDKVYFELVVDENSEDLELTKSIPSKKEKIKIPFQQRII